MVTTQDAEFVFNDVFFFISFVFYFFVDGGVCMSNDQVLGGQAPKLSRRLENLRDYLAARDTDKKKQISIPI